MLLPKIKITFKVLVGYLILGVLASISGILVLSEIKTFNQLQGQDIEDQTKILKIGNIIATIYENESLARAAIQLKSNKKFDEYLKENNNLLLKIDSLNTMIDNESQGFILDSVKLIIAKKLTNITDLKNLKLHDNSNTSINKAIDKLSSIDPLLGKIAITDFVENPNNLDKKTQENLKEYVRILNKYNPQDDLNSIDQKQIDSILSISKNVLKEAQQESNYQRQSLQKKERDLIENDLQISQKLNKLLKTLENGIIFYTNSIKKERERTLQQSQNIIVYAAGISFIIIILFSIIFLNDFWKSQRYRKQLELANQKTSSLLKSREQLISMVSHDLRTPLSTITGYSELLQNSNYSTKENHYIKHIRNASNYMRQLVDDLLEFKKIEHKNITIQSVPFNIKQLVDEVIENTKPNNKNLINFSVKLNNCEKYTIISDPFRIKQILNNLVTNAFKFTYLGGITLESKLQNNNGKFTLQISVTDTGSGISKAQQEHIFKAFTQGNNQNESHKNGFGLGLTISKKLAELLKGSLTLNSIIDKGSTFTLKIPVSVKINDANCSNTKIRAIIIEDDTALRELLRDYFKQLGIEVFIFNNAQKALIAVETISYDLVLTDIQLPKMNGVRFIEILKKHHSYRGQPLIAMTGRTNLTIKDYLDIGFSEVIIKPLSIYKIQNILRIYFNIKLEKHDNFNNECNTFSLTSLQSFLNNNSIALNKTLKIVLYETEESRLKLNAAKINNDIKKINNISHKMLTMMKQLNVKEVVPILEYLETATKINDHTFNNLEKVLNNFIIELKKLI
ncbi:hybrid sensor histidine kinase/response regulator [Neotamlana sedimentorum]|uniref:hybrid sensor histidine kinase/response regulator n=1 Tax=Neotamlana sedimentorum TaxID=1435349 RepID=UPI000699A067|nr:ATP-binding protein [Tamlana sedimentorum]